MTYTERLRHERGRFARMTIPQLQTRLRKITVSAKLAAFIQIAREHDVRLLVEQAERRADDLGYNVLTREQTGRVHLQRRGPAGREVRPRVTGTGRLPESRLPSAREVITHRTGQGRTEFVIDDLVQPDPSEEEVEQFKEEERMRLGVRKIRFNGKNKKQKEEPHQPRLPGMEE